MHFEEAPLYRIGDPASPATLVNAAVYPDSTGEKPDRLCAGVDNGGQNTITVQQGGVATFSTATLQRQVSFDGGITWVNDGAAVAVATFVTVTLFRRYLYRWLVAGTGNITAANIVIG